MILMMTKGMLERVTADESVNGNSNSEMMKITAMMMITTTIMMTILKRKKRKTMMDS